MADADPQKKPVVTTGSIATDPAAPTTSSRSWRRPALMFGIPLLIAVVAGYIWFTSGRYVSTDNAYVSQDMISISPDVSGKIVEVDVQENQRVHAGDLLFRIDPEPYRIALMQADAALASARVDIATKSTDTGSAQADIESARADIQLAQATYDRQVALMKSGFTTRASLDAAAHELAAGRARLATAEAASAHARSQLGSGSSGSGVPASIQVAQAQRAKAALDLFRTAVRAPKDGIVSQTGRLQIGTITPSGVPAMSLVVNQRAWIEANFKETQLVHMRVGQPATLRLDACPGKHVTGHVQSIGAGTGSEFSILPAQNATGNWVKVTQRVPVRIAIDTNADCATIAGLSAVVTVDTGTHR